jgi:MFS family permease
LTFFTTGGVQVFLPLYVRSLGFDSTYVGFLVGLLFIMSAVARLPFGILLNKPGLELYLVVLGLAMLALPTFFMIGVQDTLILTLLVAVAGLGFGVAALVGNMIVAREVSEHRGLAMGMNSTFRFVGLGLGPATVAGILALQGETTASYGLAFTLLALVPLVGSAFVAFLVLMGRLRSTGSA